MLSAFATRLTSLVPRPIQRLRRLYEPLQPGHERNTPEGARANISRHYDLSNELFATFLDETMTYSCADLRARRHARTAPSGASTRLMCDLVDLRSGDHVLEIGTGWGGMAMHAAATSGCRVTTITISQRQKQLAEQRIRDAGLDGQIEVLLCDYRDLQGRFDKIVSIEMFEAVGEEYWPEFFGVCDRLLAAGRAHEPADDHDAARPVPGHPAKLHLGAQVHLPGRPDPIRAGDRRRAERRPRALRIASSNEIGQHYAPTLRLWRERFLDRWDEVRGLGFDDTFRRTWEFYLAYCEAGFRSGAIGDRADGGSSDR